MCQAGGIGSARQTNQDFFAVPWEDAGFEGAAEIVFSVFYEAILAYELKSDLILGLEQMALIT